MPSASTAVDPSDNKTETAYQRLRQAILGAQLRPGDALRPAALQAAYGMGWTPLREALSRLEAERLVTTERNRGFAVAPVSMEELEDLTRARRALESSLLAESISHGDKAWEDALILAHYRLQSAALPVGPWTDEAIERWFELHHAFHLALLGGGASVWLKHFYGQTMEQERRHHRVLMIVPLLREEASAPGQPNPAMAALREAITTDHHTELMQAALARDLPRAAALMAEHVNYKSQVFASSQPAEARSKQAPAPPRRRGRPAKQVTP